MSSYACCFNFFLFFNLSASMNPINPIVLVNELKEALGKVLTLLVKSTNQ